MCCGWRERSAFSTGRRLGKTRAEFEAVLPDLLARGFPQADPTTGNFDLAAIDRWCDGRHPHLFGGAAVMWARDAAMVAKERIAAMRAGQARPTEGGRRDPRES